MAHEYLSIQGKAPHTPQLMGSEFIFSKYLPISLIETDINRPIHES